jgi:hypothetical protein
LKKFIKEEIQQPKQVFNCDKSRVFWEENAQENLHSSKCIAVTQLKTGKGTLTLILYDNTAGHMLKTRHKCRAKNPCTFKNKAKNYLPMFWQHNQKVWVVNILSMEYFHQCFIPEVKKYLQ